MLRMSGKEKPLARAPRGLNDTAMASRKSADERAKALAPIVRELRDAGMVTLKELADELNKRKVPTVHGGRWYHATVSRLLWRLRRLREPMA